MGISFLWVLILGIGIIFFPESPRYAYRNGRIEEAKRTMTKLYGVSDNHRVVAEELEEIKVKHEEELLYAHQSWWQMFQGMSPNGFFPRGYPNHSEICIVVNILIPLFSS